MHDLLSRRRFIQALAASVVAVGAPLPIGFPKDPWAIQGASMVGSAITLPPGTYNFSIGGVTTGRWSLGMPTIIEMNINGKIFKRSLT